MPRSTLLADEAMKTTAITLPPTMWQAYRKACQERGVTASAEIRAFIQSELDKAQQNAKA
jgi:hypothetical protein